MKITKSTPTQFTIENISELKDVFLKLLGGRKSPVDIVINQKTSEEEINNLLDSPVNEIYPGNKKIDYFGDGEVKCILDSCQYYVRNIDIKSTKNKTTISIDWEEEN
jgi:uncharacterized protein YdaL